MAPVFDLGVYLVTDRDLSGPRGVVATVAAAIEGGITLVQLRDPDGITRDMVATGRALIELLRPRGIPLIVNDRIDVALAIDADGVHVGQSDMAPADVRRLIGPAKILGFSVTTLAEAIASESEPVDYLGVGPIYAQTTKLNAAPPLGLDGLAAIRAGTTRPIVAIGGVGVANAAGVLGAGADGLAVVSAIMAAADPARAAAEMASFVRTARMG